MEITQSLSEDHGKIKLEINNRKKTGKSPNTQRLNNTPLNNTGVKEEISREILKYFQLKENRNPDIKICDAVKTLL